MTVSLISTTIINQTTFTLKFFDANVPVGEWLEPPGITIPGFSNGEINFAPSLNEFGTFSAEVRFAVLFESADRSTSVGTFTLTYAIPQGFSWMIRSDTPQFFLSAIGDTGLTGTTTDNLLYGPGDILLYVQPTEGSLGAPPPSTGGDVGGGSEGGGPQRHPPTTIE